MSDFFEKLKKTISKGAAESAAKMEVVARQGKIHLEILNENRKLNSAFEDLGKWIYSHSPESLEGLKENEEFAKILGKINIVETELESLKTKLKEEELAHQKKQEEAKAAAEEKATPTPNADSPVEQEETEEDPAPMNEQDKKANGSSQKN